MAQSQTTSLAKRNELSRFLRAPEATQQLQRACTEAMTAERLIKIGQTLLTKNNFDRVDKISFYNALLESASLGLEPMLGRLYFIPYGDQLQVQLGYQGLLELGRRGGVTATAHLDYEGDEFEWFSGFSDNIIHKPNLQHERTDSDIIYAYCVWKDASGEKHAEVMTRKEIDRIRRCSKCGGWGPWKDFYGEMCKKTVVRRAAKYWPLTFEAMSAIERDDERNYNKSEVQDSVNDAILDLARQLKVTTQATTTEIENKSN